MVTRLGARLALAEAEEVMATPRPPNPSTQPYNLNPPLTPTPTLTLAPTSTLTPTFTLTLTLTLIPNP